ncbi:MAG: DNA mismatch repair protein MutS [Boseongicola sp.]|nr:MAG: DNA mismatch repair protein MutS [Boseongicola sp.]
MKRRPPRGLKPEERELWQRVAKTATPLNPKKSLDTPADEEKKQKAVPDHKFQVPRFEIGSNAVASKGSGHYSGAIPATQQTSPIKMDKKAFLKMKRGKSQPEARIDLHGMTVADARPALASFIFRSHGQGKRLVLVITGKGRQAQDEGPIPARIGILRHHVPQWLSGGAMQSIVLQVTEAHQRHGGSGAFYVFLRRS